MDICCSRRFGSGAVSQRNANLYYQSRHLANAVHRLL
jgi:hypothetical protein